jgi:epoxyqueuosine reductase
MATSGAHDRSPAEVRSRAVKSFAARLGFDAVGICDLRPIERAALRPWLAAGHAGTMAYMGRQADRRERPADIVSGATRAVVTLSSYYRPGVAPAAGARVARYAWGDDYHRVLGERLTALATHLCSLGASRERTRTYVDAGPLPERELAQRAGLGWIAKNTMLIHPGIGSYTFIGCVLTDLELTCDASFATDHCGSCRACLDLCPTGAIVAPYRLDARRCISYLTIEHDGPIPEALRPLMGNRIYGCDDCQLACPWNEKFALPSGEPRFAPRRELAAPSAERLARIGDEDFDRTYADTAFARTRAAGLRRNARAVLANQEEASRPLRK